MTNGNGVTDEAIVRSVLGGDAEAYGRLVERYRARLFGLAFHLCGDYDLASDLTQETLIAGYQCLDRIRNPASFASWISSILRNRFRSLARLKTPRPLSLDALMEAGFDPPAPDNGQDVSDEDLAQVMRCVDALPGKYRETLLLRYTDDLSYKKIAEFLDVPVTTVTTRLNYARRLLVKKAKECGLV